MVNKTIKQFIAKADHGGRYFEVEAETFDEAREILINDQFNGYLYEETYQLISTTPHVIKELRNNQIGHARQIGKQKLTALVKDYTDEESIHIEFIDEFKKELHLRINDDIEQSLHDELVKLGWTPPEKGGE